MGLSFRGALLVQHRCYTVALGHLECNVDFEGFQAMWASLAKAVQASVLKPCVGIAVSSK